MELRVHPMMHTTRETDFSHGNIQDYKATFKKWLKLFLYESAGKKTKDVMAIRKHIEEVMDKADDKELLTMEEAATEFAKDSGLSKQTFTEFCFMSLDGMLLGWWVRMQKAWVMRQRLEGSGMKNSNANVHDLLRNILPICQNKQDVEEKIRLAREEEIQRRCANVKRTAENQRPEENNYDVKDFARMTLTAEMDEKDFIRDHVPKLDGTILGELICASPLKEPWGIVKRRFFD